MPAVPVTGKTKLMIKLFCYWRRTVEYSDYVQFTSAYMELHHLIWQKCALRLLPALVAVISFQQLMAISDLLVLRTITYGSHSLAVSGHCIWNDLPLTPHASPLTQTVSKHTEDNTVSFSLRDIIWHFRDCLGH